MGEGPKNNHGELGLVDDLRRGASTVKARLAGKGRAFLDSGRQRGGQLILGAVDAIDSFANQEQGVPKTRLELVRHHAALGARKAIEWGKQYRLIDPANIQKLPRLIDDEKEDLKLKSQIVDNLNSGMGTMSTFYDLIVFTSNICFNKGIPRERLTKFFESDRVLRLLIQNVFDEEDSSFRSPNVLAFVGSLVGAVSAGLKSESSEVEKKKIDEKTRKELEVKIQTFKEEYDPEDSYTFGVFTEGLKEDYKEYDLNPWLEEQVPFFIEMLRGYKGDHVTGKQHVENMVHSAYEERTKDQNLQEEFIRTHVGHFFHVMSPFPQINPRKDMPGFIIDLKALSKFFQKLGSIETLEVGEGKMIDMIVKICNEETKKHGNIKNGITLMIDKGSAAEIITIENPEDINGKIADIIDQAVKVSAPHVNNQNLLVNPRGIPEKITREYDKIFDQGGNLEEREYHTLLRSIFEYREEDGQKKERMDSIRRRITKIFHEVNETLKDHFSRAGVAMPKEIAEIMDINDYSEIIKIAATEKDDRKRYAARLKKEIFDLVYRGSYNPRFVFREDDARKVKAEMEATLGDIQIDENEPIKTLKFIDHKDGRTELIEDCVTDKLDTHPEKAVAIGELKLIPAKFAGQDCYLIQGGDHKKPHEYINIKSLRSIVTKLIIEQKTDPDEVTDTVRMTFSVETLEELMELKRKVEINLVPGVRLIKWEDTYTEPQGNGTKHLGKNDNKSKDYKTLRAVCYVPVYADGRVYLVKFEVRVLLLADAIKEKSQHNEMGHIAYEKKRSLSCIPVLAPKEIFPELYEESKNPNSYSGRVRTRIKQVLPNMVFSESQAPKTPQEPSLPASL